MAKPGTPRDPSSEHLEKILPAPPDQLEAVRENQRSVQSALDPKGLPQSEHYGKRSGARPTEERSIPRCDRVDCGKLQAELVERGFDYLQTEVSGAQVPPSADPASESPCPRATPSSRWRHPRLGLVLQPVAPVSAGRQLLLHTATAVALKVGSTGRTFGHGCGKPRNSDLAR